MATKQQSIVFTKLYKKYIDILANAGEEANDNATFLPIIQKHLSENAKIITTIEQLKALRFPFAVIENCSDRLPIIEQSDDEEFEYLVESIEENVQDFGGFIVFEINNSL